ncbi:MAG: DUF4167 domain-containing protein [Alphaproteobacteria bacterium]|nr:DUF4167 domain-containing protein [Alphaproteobacteria bacterium]MBV8549581.1 DUF4167 domain-containing protein [Alphaproteobacteria bacterium]
MRQGQNGRRPRGRHHNGGQNSGNQGGGNGNRPRSAAALRHQTFDSNCIDLRVRGNAWQVHEKYQALARDAQASGDRVAAENYLQHAEHYYRIIEAINEATAAEQRARGGTGFSGQQPDVPNGYYGDPNAPQPATDANGNVMPLPPAAQPMAQAEVQPVRPPQANSFFTAEEVEETRGGEEQLVANR